jgi:hypothetical protein
MWITFPIGLPSLSSISGPLTLKGTTGKIKCAKDPVRYPNKPTHAIIGIKP